MGKDVCHVRPQMSHHVNPLNPIGGNARAFANRVEDYTDPALNQVRSNAKVTTTPAWVSGITLLPDTINSPRTEAKLRMNNAEKKEEQL